MKEVRIVDTIKIDMQFVDEGYGIKHFIQKIGNLEFAMEDLAADETQQANEIVSRAWDWVFLNIEDIKDYLSVQLAEKFARMRRNKEKNVPPDTAESIRSQLTQIDVSRVTLFPNQSAFSLDFMGRFNGYSYRMYVTVNDDFTYKRGGILTMGGFLPPKDEPKQNLKKAAALYDYHIRHGNEKGLYKHYVALSTREINTFIKMLVEDKEISENDRCDLMLYLALFSHACGETLPDALYTYLLDNEIFYFPEIYLRADEKVAAKLMSLLDEVDDAEAYQLSVNHILCALAMIPCKPVNDFLLKSSSAPLPIWAEKLHILPKEYAKVGGWEAVYGGMPRMLIRPEVIAYKRCEKKEATPDAPVASLEENCGFCGQPLTLVSSGKEKLATCLHCSCYQTIFTKEDAGKICWHPANAPSGFFQKYPDYMKNDEDITLRFPYAIKPSKEARHAIWSSNEFANISYTQTGGMPTAINDVEYPICPDCGKTMCFAAQFDMADIEKNGEGLYYFFVCEDCGVCGSNYGQS